MIIDRYHLSVRLSGGDRDGPLKWLVGGELDGWLEPWPDGRPGSCWAVRCSGVEGRGIDMAAAVADWLRRRVGIDSNGNDD